MTKKTAIDALLHPVRLRIVRAFLGGAKLTAQDLAQRLDDVPQATLYRHVKRLVEAGTLIVSSQVQVRGALERTYQLDPNTGKVTPEDIGAIDKETHLKYFSILIASLLEDFGRYMRADNIDVVRDHVHYMQVTFNAGSKEFGAFMKELELLIQKFAKPASSKGRVQRTVSIVTLPESAAKARK